MSKIPNPFRFEDLLKDKTRVVVRTKMDGDSDLTTLTDLRVIKGKFGTFLGSELSEGAASFAINLSREIDSTKRSSSPVAYLSQKEPGAEKGTSVCNLWMARSQAGNDYLRGKDDSGRRYYVFVSDDSDASEAGAAGRAASPAAAGA